MSQRIGSPVSNNLYKPLDGFYASPMYMWVVDDFGNQVVGVWAICEILNSETH